MLAIQACLPTLRLHSQVFLENKIGQQKLVLAETTFSSFLESGVDSPLTKVEQSALAEQCLRSLIRYLDVISIPVTLKNILSNLSLLETAVDIDFPGYYRNRMLRFVVAPLPKVKVA